MTNTLFYRTQAEQQQRAADDAALDNVRDRCQRASNAWNGLAARSEQSDTARSAAAVKKYASESGA